MHATQAIQRAGLWSRTPVTVRAIVSGLLIGLVGANVWLVLLGTLGVLPGALAELVFLSLYIWWAAGGGPPRSWQEYRSYAFRRGTLSAQQWVWGLTAAVFFAASIHTSIVLLFRFVPFPVAAFRRGYDLSAIASPALKWLLVVIAAASAGICEETGFRGYMQRPLEERYSPGTAVLVSSFFFTIVHLNKSWELAGVLAITFAGGLLLGVLAWSSGSLVPGMIGHVLMDVGLFAYWWTGIAGTFTARPIGETGLDGPFLIACLTLAASVGMVMVAMGRLRRHRQANR